MKNLLKLSVALYVIFLVLSEMVCCGQSVPTSVVGNAAATNNLIVSSAYGTKLYWVSCNNTSNTIVYVQIFQTNAVPANGAVPTFSYPCSATSFLTYDFSAYGVDLDRVTICTSTTANSLTLTTACASLQAIYRQK